MILDLKRDQVAALILRQPGGVELKFTKNAEGKWLLEGHDIFEEKAAAALVSAVTPLLAGGWSGQPIAPSNDTLLTIQTADGATHTVAFNDQFGSTEGLDQPFLLSEPLRNALTAEYRDRAVLHVSADEIESVTIQRQGDEPVTVRKLSGRYVAEGMSELNEEAAAGVFDALAGLRVVRYETRRTVAAQQDAVMLTIHRRSGEPIVLHLIEDGHYATISPAFDDYRDGFLLDDATWKN